jgi:hypothetical protein
MFLRIFSCLIELILRYGQLLRARQNSVTHSPRYSWIDYQLKEILLPRMRRFHKWESPFSPYTVDCLVRPFADG